jgi:uncharacterized protein with HEPN domain
MYRDSALYLEDILEAIRKIRKYVSPLTFDNFCQDEKTVDAVVRNLEIIGEASKKLPDDLKNLHPEIEWRKITAIRNIVVHQYFGIDNHIIWDVVSTKLDSLFEAATDLINRKL